MTALRLALVTRRFWPLVGGAETVMANLAAELRRQGHDVVLVTAQWEPEWPTQLVHREIPVVRLPNPRQRGWGTLRYMTALGRWFRQRREHLDLVYVSMLKHDAYVAVSLLKDSPCPVVLRAEGGGPLGDCHWQASARFGKRIRRRCQKADALVAPSTAIQHELLEAGYHQQLVHFVPNGVPIREPYDARRQQQARAALTDANWDLLAPPDAPVALFTGRLHDGKGLLTLVDAWRIVVQTHRDARLWLVGEGPLRDELFQRISDYELRRNILLPGVFDDVSELLIAADLFLLPSFEEGMSMALLEAMAARLPCIASDIPGNRHLINTGQHGLLTPPGDPAALAAAILELIADPLRARSLGEVAAERVAENFSVTQATQRHLELFGALIDNKNRR
jgi:glycosyltransferase involved in cell wall biosynthesis